MNRADLAGVRLLVLDVDGVLTDGRLRYGPEGEQEKLFHVRGGQPWGGRCAGLS